MQKLILWSCIVLATLVLSGCGSSDTATDTTDTTAWTWLFAIDACNSYVDIMKCMAEKSPTGDSTGAQEMFDRTIEAWKLLTPEQLQANCDATMQVIEDNKDYITQIGCTVK